MAGFIRRTAVAKGVFGNSRLWLAVAVIIYGRRLMRKLTGSAPETVFSEELAPGETLVIAHQRDAVVRAGR